MDLALPSFPSRGPSSPSRSPSFETGFPLSQEFSVGVKT